MTDRLRIDLERLVDLYGPDAVMSEVQSIANQHYEWNVCTIVANEGVHHFPSHILIGDLFVFSEGMIDMSTEESMHQFLESRLIALSEYLKSKKWKEIYLVISGHPSISLQIKLLVYQITRLTTVDLIYNGTGYLRLHIDIRKIAATRRGRVQLNR
jgi:hypothetical protein